MSTLWIVDRDPQRRAALARAASAPESAVSGGPGDPRFDWAAMPHVVLMGLGGDLEAELEFAHRIAVRFPDVRWVLVAERNDTALARELFDAIDVEIFPFPPDARTLRARLRATPRVAGPMPLSMRPARDLLSQRFARWFADLELPELLQAIDPDLGDTPLLIFGEDGTGRGLLARYVHGYSQAAAGWFAHLVCTASMTEAQLQNALRDATGDADASVACTIWLDETDLLPISTQRKLARWIEFQPPVGTLRHRVVRWIATAGDEFEPGVGPSLHPALRDALSGISVRIPPVRQRPHLIAPFANDTALAWCAARRQNPRRFGEDAIAVLEEYPWSGNLRELQAVVVQTLATGAADPIRADDLQYAGTAFAPINASEVGVMIGADEGHNESWDKERSDLNGFDAFDPTTQPASAEGRVPREPIPPPKASQQQQPTDTVSQGETEGVSRVQPASFPEAPAFGLQRLVGAIAHEIRNPLSTIRTFTELLPNRYDDPDFRETFTELVAQDARRLERVLTDLSGLAALGRPNPVPVDIAALVEELLEQRRARVHERKLLVLKELESGSPPALVDELQIRTALDSIFDKTIELAPERGDIYVATRHHPAGLRGGPAIRILIRFGSRNGLAKPDVPKPQVPRIAGVSAAENALSFAIAEAIVRSQSGAFAINVAEGDETVILMDIPAAVA